MTSVAAPARARRRKAGISWGAWLFGAALVLLILFTLFPFYWAIVASLTPDAALFRDPSLWPQQIILDHYRALFGERDFITPIRNSLVVAGTTTIFCLCVGTLAAYALARLEFKGKAPIMGFILAVTMFPQISIVSPLYLLLRSLHLIDTYPGLIMPYMTFAMHSRSGFSPDQFGRFQRISRKPRTWTAPRAGKALRRSCFPSLCRASRRREF